MTTAYTQTDYLKSDELNVEKVIKHEIFDNGEIIYRFSYQVNKKTVPLSITLTFPNFSGKEVQPYTYSYTNTLFKSASNLNQDQETRLVLFLNKLAKKCNITLKEHLYVTRRATVYSATDKIYLNDYFTTLDGLICSKLNGATIQPRFVQQNSNWICICEIILACVYNCQCK